MTPAQQQAYRHPCRSLEAAGNPKLARSVEVKGRHVRISLAAIADESGHYWLCSVALMSGVAPKKVRSWNRHEQRLMGSVLEEVLSGVGDVRQEDKVQTEGFAAILRPMTADERAGLSSWAGRVSERMRRLANRARMIFAARWN